MTVQRGDVVLLQAPFTSRGGAKTRPMLVVQQERHLRWQFQLQKAKLYAFWLE